ncbi:MAG: TonB-dependent receptor, partial [Acinetobacter towneri]
AVRSAKFKPYKENGVAYPIRAEQPFELTLNPNG